MIDAWIRTWIESMIMNSPVVQFDPLNQSIRLRRIRASRDGSIDPTEPIKRAASTTATLAIRITLSVRSPEVAKSASPERTTSSKSGIAWLSWVESIHTHQSLWGPGTGASRGTGRRLPWIRSVCGNSSRPIWPAFLIANPQRGRCPCKPAILQFPSLSVPQPGSGCSMHPAMRPSSLPEMRRNPTPAPATQPAGPGSARKSVRPYSLGHVALRPVQRQVPAGPRWALLQRSTNLVDWEDWKTVNFDGTDCGLTDDVGTNSRRFYRAVEGPAE